MNKKLTLVLGIVTIMISGCAIKQPKAAPELIVTTIPQPSFNILKVYSQSPVVIIPPQDQTVVCNGCDESNANISQNSDVIWVKLVPQEKRIETIINSEHFDFDRAIIKGDLTQLKDISDRLISDRTLTTEVIGHTDSIGKPEYNLILGAKRAKAVENWLIQQGVHKDQITTKSDGESHPIASNKTTSGRSQNRRAVVVINVVGY